MNKVQEKKKLYLGVSAGVLVIAVVVLAIVFSSITPTKAETGPSKEEVTSGFSTTDEATITLDLDEDGSKDKDKTKEDDKSQ